jgi:hypothetical protein
MIRRIAIASIPVALLFIIIVSLQADVSTVERSLRIDASAEQIWPYVSDLQKWVTIEPWSKRDPNIQLVFSDVTTGVAAFYTWQGNDEVGSGKMTLLEEKAHEYVRYHLEFIEPFSDTAAVELRINQEGSQSTLTWSMRSENNFTKKIFLLFMDFEATIGADFEEGLANIAKAVTSKALSLDES